MDAKVLARFVKIGNQKFAKTAQT